MGKLGTTFNIKKYTDSNGEAKQVVDTVLENEVTLPWNYMLVW